MKMNSLLLAGLVAGLLTFAATTSLFAADKGKETTLAGDVTCAKCALHEGDHCQNVLQVSKDGKTVNYYLMGNASKAFHENVCHEAKKATVTGILEEKNGKNEIEVTKIELAK